MSEQPTVCCVCLTADRQEMTARAVRCFEAQTYANKRLYIYDTGVVPCTEALPDFFPQSNIVYHRGLNERLTIGALRNRANWWGVRPSATREPDCDIIAHWDSDDWSHPNRLAEQVALLQSSGADCVGYREMLFWDSRKYVARVEKERSYHESREGLVNEAWLYTSQHAKPYALGTSLCSWRRTWEQKPFKEVDRGEDKEFIQGLKLASVSSLGPLTIRTDLQTVDAEIVYLTHEGEPRMIASIHAGNSASYDLESIVARGCREWKRVPQWDERCRSIMEGT